MLGGADGEGAAVAALVAVFLVSSETEEFRLRVHGYRLELPTNLREDYTITEKAPPSTTTFKTNQTPKNSR